MALRLPPQDLTPEQLYLGHLHDIDRIAACAAKRRRFRPEDVEDFVSLVRLRLLQDNYAVIRKFRGASTFRTYLQVTIAHLVADYANHVLGKWRASEEAKRLGEIAVRLEVLLVRERLSLNEACNFLLINQKVPSTRAALEKIALRLPNRNPPRRMEGEEALVNRPTREENPEEDAIRRETERRLQEISKLFSEALETLPAQDRLIARMYGRFQVARIAETLHLEQKPLYRRIGKIFKQLRDRLEQMGVRREDIRETLGVAGVSLQDSADEDPEEDEGEDGEAPEK